MRVRDDPHRLLEVADLRRLEQAQATDHRVRDVLVAQPGDDRVAVLVFAVQDGDVVGAAGGPVDDGRLDRIDDDDGLVLGPGTGDDPDRGSVGALGAEALVGFDPGHVLADQPVGGGQDVTHGTEVLLQPETTRRPGSRHARVMDRRPTEARIELHEGGEAGSPESIDGLVVVAHDHDVVRAVRRAAEQLDELDLGDVRVLELIDEQVSKLALVATQDVGPRPEQLDDRTDLAAEVEGAPLRELGLVRAVHPGELDEAQDFERGPVGDVGVGEGVDARLVLVREPAPWMGVPIAGDRPSGLTSRHLLGALGVVLARLAGGLGTLVGAHTRIGAADRAERPQVALELESSEGGVEATVARLEDALLLGDEGIEGGRRDELVLASIDELDERAEPPGRRVVDQPEAVSDVLEQQQLADPIEDLRARRQPGIGGVLGQDPLAEAVEVADRQAGGDRRARRVPDTVLELRGRLDVVGQDEDLLW